MNFVTVGFNRRRVRTTKGPIKEFTEERKGLLKDFLFDRERRKSSLTGKRVWSKDQRHGWGGSQGDCNEMIPTISEVQ